ncbi:MAG TPA: hypothetical protein VGN86_09365 [Pyrinomonadaceae bacterium]|nr:hypothetical protein [Pyrinomonadaceae bacterium]
MTNKIVAVALITALIGASLGAAVMHSRDTSRANETSATLPASTINADARDARYLDVSDQKVPAEFTTASEQTAYKVGFSDGFQAATEGRSTTATRSNLTYRRAPVYRSSAGSRRVYYDYSRPQGRSFWSKHRDKLTMAMGSGGGALVGALIGGKKGAAIGGLAGLGGSALYTYKLRKRHR